MGRVLCAVVGHRYLYGERAGAAGPPTPAAWVCRRCGDRQEQRPPPARPGWELLGGWGGWGGA